MDYLCFADPPYIQRATLAYSNLYCYSFNFIKRSLSQAVSLLAISASYLLLFSFYSLPFTFKVPRCITIVV